MKCKLKQGITSYSKVLAISCEVKTSCDSKNWQYGKEIVIYFYQEYKLTQPLREQFVNITKVENNHPLKLICFTLRHCDFTY